MKGCAAVSGRARRCQQQVLRRPDYSEVLSAAPFCGRYQLVCAFVGRIETLSLSLSLSHSLGFFLASSWLGGGRTSCRRLLFEENVPAFAYLNGLFVDKRRANHRCRHEAQRRSKNPAFISFRLGVRWRHEHQTLRLSFVIAHSCSHSIWAKTRNTSRTPDNLTRWRHVKSDVAWRQKIFSTPPPHPRRCSSASSTTKQIKIKPPRVATPEPRQREKPKPLPAHMTVAAAFPGPRHNAEPFLACPRRGAYATPNKGRENTQLLFWWSATGAEASGCSTSVYEGKDQCLLKPISVGAGLCPSRSSSDSPKDPCLKCAGHER